MTVDSPTSPTSPEERRRLLAARLATRAAQPTPLAPHAARLWFLQGLEPASTAYSETVGLRLVGPLDADALTAGLTALVARHEWLRSRVVEQEGYPAQRVLPQEPVPLVRADLRDLDAATAWALELADLPFDLAAQAPWRVGLGRMDHDEHVLVLVLHHIACDGWSVDVLLGELADLYDAHVTGEEADLPPVSSPRDIAERLAAAVPAGTTAEQRAQQWAARLDGTAPDARVGTASGAAPADEAGDAASLSVPLDPPLATRVRALAEQSGATPFAVVSAAVAVATARFTGRDDAVLGMPVDLRWALPRSEHLVAFLVETAAVAARDLGRATARDVVTGVHAEVQEALGGVPPLHEVVAELRRRGTLGSTGSPLHTYVNWLEDERLATLGDTGPALAPLDLPAGEAKFDLNWTVLHGQRQLRLRLEYDARNVGAERAQHLLDTVLAVLAAITAAPDEPLGSLDLLPEAERSRLQAWGGEAAATPDLDLWTAVTRSADAAVESGGTTLRGSALVAAAEAIAGALVRAGVRPGDAVGVSTQRGPGLVPSVLGILRAGACFVPVDTAHPHGRQQELLRDVGAAALLGPAVWAQATADGTDALPVGLDAAGGPTAPAQTRPPFPVRRPGDRAYVLYTSGSTGRPKGVVVSDAAVVARIGSYQDLWPETGLRWLLASTLSFDASIYLFWALAVGGTVVVPADDTATDPRALERVLRESAISHTFLVPSLYDLVLGSAHGSWPALRRMYVGGEVFLPSLASRHAAVAPGATLHNVYGPTETITTATQYDVRVATTGEGPVPIGVPHPGTTVRVVDAQGRLVPVGVPGELRIGGPAVADGYHGDPELTAQRFAAGPPREYATGDLVRWRPVADGAVLDYLGRRDRQIKLRGQRIELGEVEAALRAQPGVTEATVELTGEGLARSMVAIVGGPDAADADRILDGAARVLPPAWVPGHVVVVAALPRVPSGKLDGAALREMATAGAASVPTPEASPATFLERRVAAVMAVVLGRDTVDVDEDFFQIGGHSLLAARFVAELGERMGFEVPLAVLAGGASPREIAVAVDEGLAAVLSGASTVARLLPVRESGAGAPVVIVARDGEATLYLRHLLRTEGLGRPLWALILPAPPLGPTIPDLREQADAAVATLRRQFGDSPVHLVGHSASGLVALLAANGCPPGSAVLLLDTLIPASSRHRDPFRLYGRWHAALRRVSFALRRPGLLRRAVDEPGSLTPIEVRAIRNLQVEVAATRLGALRADGPVRMITAETTTAELGPDLGWGERLPRTRYFNVPGDHMSILISPHVEETARAVLEALSDLP